MTLNGHENVDIRTRGKFLPVGEACAAIFRPTPGLKVRTLILSAPGSQRRRP